MSEQGGASKRVSSANKRAKWPSISVWILGYFDPQCSHKGVNDDDERKWENDNGIDGGEASGLEK